MVPQLYKIEFLSSLTLCNPMVWPWNSLGKITRLGCHSLLQGIFPIQGSNPGLMHCRQILYHLSYQGSLWEVIVVCFSHISFASTDLGKENIVTQLVKNPPAMWETWVRSQGWEDPLEKGKATNSSILASRIPWTIQSMGSQRVGHDWAAFTFKVFQTSKREQENIWHVTFIWETFMLKCEIYQAYSN